jgi:hypothetical protein
MICTRCNADNVEGRKFCGSCGCAIGAICDRCGIANPLGDKYCGMCGFALFESLKQGSSPLDPSDRPLSAAPGQYTARDIEELLVLRTKVQKEEDSTETLRQDDIDSLFGQVRP